MISRIRFEELYRSSRFTLTDVSCAGCDTPGSAEEATSETKLVFVRAGSFLRQTCREELFVEAGSVVVFHPDEPYRTRHPVRGGDRCTSIGVSDDTLRALVAPLAPRLADADVLHLPESRTTVSSDVFLEHNRLLRDVRQRPLEDDGVEATLLRLVRRYLREVLGRGPADAGRSRRHRELAARARELLASCFRERIPLEEIAGALDVSLFHLCRVFHAEVGLSLHRYRTRLRLRSALELLEDPSLDLTRLALHLGFSSHSHFTSSFRREFGTTPALLRGRRRTSVPPRGGCAAGSP